MKRRFPLLLALVAATAPAAPAALRVRVSPAVAPCVAVAAQLFSAPSGERLALETDSLEDAASARGADVVVGMDVELTRLLEGEAWDPALDVRVARVPWVLVDGRASDGEVHARLQDAGRVFVPGGAVGRAARRALAGVPQGHVGTLRIEKGALALEAGDAAVVPLSLAGSRGAAPLPFPPLTVRALGVRGTARAASARAFLEFLSAGPGNAAFVGCGRSETR